MTAINSLAGSVGPATQPPNRFNELSSDEFIKIMVTELSNQDPFEPNDSAAILEQLSSLRNIEAQQALQDQIKSLVTQNAIASAGGFIGKHVTGLDANNSQVSGLVTSLRIEDGKPILVLDSGGALAADRLLSVSQVESPAAPPSDSPPSLAGDATRDGLVTGRDLIAVLQNFGSSIASPAVAPLADQAVLNSSTMLGKLVRGLDAEGREVEGIVRSIEVKEGRLVLELDSGQSLTADDVKQVANAPGASPI